MWKFLLDPVIQGLLFLLAVAALAYVGWDLFDEARSPSAAMPSVRRRREPPRQAAAARPRVRLEPSVETWTDAQGETQGRVQRGPCRGRRLDELNREDCERQAVYCRDHDPAAAVALESYIRFRFGPQRRYEPQPAGGITRGAALAELGLREGASEADIHAAYRAMIKLHHPDHGGSHAKAARINQAKAALEG